MDEHQVEVVASDESDALADLVEAVIAISRGDARTDVMFAESSTGGFDWSFRRVDKNRVRIKIVEYMTETAVFDAECAVRDLASALLSELDRLKDKFGDAGYKDLWVGFAFPNEGRRRLAEEVKSMELS